MKNRSNQRGNTFIEFALLVMFLSLVAGGVMPKVRMSVQAVYTKVTTSLQRASNTCVPINRASTSCTDR